MRDGGLAADRAFFGHPRGLGWLAGTELWERFSYYGMQTLLVLYLVHYLLLPGHVAHVWGFAPFRAGLEAAYGPLSVQALGSAIFGLYAGFVWMTPMLGGLVADRWFGRTRTILAGGLLMALGHVLMAFEATFLIALLCLLIGVGMFKGNLASQVSGLYAAGDPRAASAFQIYYLAIQLAVVITPLVCGTLGEVYGWHWGFGVAAGGMVIGLAVYLRGRRWLAAEPPPGRRRSGPGGALSAAEWRRVGVLCVLLIPLSVGCFPSFQTQNVYPLWAEQTLDLTAFGHAVPVTWLQSIDAFFTSSTLLLSLAFWRWWRRRWAEPDEITMITGGTFVIALGALVLAAPSWLAAQSGHHASMLWVIPYEFLTCLGAMNFLPVGLSLYARAAPAPVRGTMIGAYYLQIFGGTMIVGWAGGYLERLGGVHFWLYHAAATVAAGCVLLALRGPIGRALAPE